jgi:hypothetical protein
MYGVLLNRETEMKKCGSEKSSPAGLLACVGPMGVRGR